MMHGAPTAPGKGCWLHIERRAEVACAPAGFRGEVGLRRQCNHKDLLSFSSADTQTCPASDDSRKRSGAGGQ